MALIDEDKLQGNVIQILQLLKKEAACDSVITSVWAVSSVVAGPVFVTISRCGTATVYTQPGGTVLTPAQYGTLTPA